MPEHTYPVTFPADGPIDLSVRQQSGAVVVTATDTDEVTVDLTASGPNADDLLERTRVDYRSGALRIEVPKGQLGLDFGRSSVDVLVTVPSGSKVDLQTGSGDIELSGELGAVVAKTGSGEVVADQCADARIRTGSGSVVVRESGSIAVRTGSGDIRVDHADGPADLESGSGDIQVVKSIASGRATSASGDVSVATVTGKVELKTASGDISVAEAVEGDIQAKSASGDVSVAIANGTAARLDVSSVSGSVRSELTEADGPGEAERKLLLTAHTVSGSIKLRRT